MIDRLVLHWFVSVEMAWKKQYFALRYFSHKFLLTRLIHFLHTVEEPNDRDQDNHINCKVIHTRQNHPKRLF